MPPVGFEPAIPAGEQPQTYAIHNYIQIKFLKILHLTGEVKGS